MEYIEGILLALVALLSVWLKHKQDTVQRRIQQDVDAWKIGTKRKEVGSRRMYATIYALMHTFREKHKLDRLFVIQPITVEKPMELNVQFETDDPSIISLMDSLQPITIRECPEATKTLATTDFIYFRNIEEEMHDDYLKSLMLTYGCHSMAVKRLIDKQGDWVGSLVAQVVDDRGEEREVAKRELTALANRLQYILPEMQK